jgi:hypothetical protein
MGFMLLADRTVFVPPTIYPRPIGLKACLPDREGRTAQPRWADRASCCGALERLVRRDAIKHVRGGCGPGATALLA